MAIKLILLDTSILIDYFRKPNKKKTILVELINKGYTFSISTITKFEIYTGATENQLEFWNTLFKNFKIFSFDEKSADIASKLNTELKKKRKQIDIADLFIASIAIAQKIPIATSNKKHFERIDGITIID
jgi:tRNA(fMet)-specific endonuclease VapC